MSAKPRSAPVKSAIELRSGKLTVPVLRLRVADVAEVVAELEAKIGQAPEFFRNAPLMIELNDLAAGSAVDLVALMGGLRALGMVPIGVRGGDEEQHQAATSAGLVVFAEGRSEGLPLASTEAAQAPAPEPEVHYIEMRSRLVTHPVRSGQRIYAQGGDLIVLAPVSAGAEIIADGHIHVYSTLRGRALAGVRGDLDCRIFCRDLQAELVSVAGHYRVSENLDQGVRGKAVQVYLKGESLIIDPL